MRNEHGDPSLNSRLLAFYIALTHLGKGTILNTFPAKS